MPNYWRSRSGLRLTSVGWNREIRNMVLLRTFWISFYVWCVYDWKKLLYCLFVYTNETNRLFSTRPWNSAMNQSSNFKRGKPRLGRNDMIRILMKQSFAFTVCSRSKFEFQSDIYQYKKKWKPLSNNAEFNLSLEKDKSLQDLPLGSLCSCNQYFQLKVATGKATAY